MSKESVALGVAGVLFGFLTGWIIGAQQARPASAPAAVGAQAAAPGTQAPGASAGGQAPAQEAPRLDQARVDELRKRAADNPRDAAVRAELGNAYFDAERYPEAITWYEASLDLNAKNVDVSTDLGVSYYYANQADRALAQFERSLEISPKHTKTMLNIGVVRAFGKQDLNGAATIWQQVVEIAPESAEGRAAKRMIDAVRSAHPDTPGGATPGATPGAGGPGASATRPQENGAP
jgi:tetratricopeptide (TPR) repeat protein